MRTSNVTYLVKKGISSVWKNLLMSFASFSILMVSLLLVGCSVLLMMNVNTIMKNIEDTNEIAIYLGEDVTQKQKDHIRAVLEKNGEISEVTYRSKEEALEEFRGNMAEYSELLDYLDENPMPETFLVRVSDISRIRQVVTEINSIEGVEKVQAPYDFAGILIEIRNTFSIIAGAVLLALVIVSIVIVSNTIRTSVFSRRNEISIMRYVGATSGFIKTLMNLQLLRIFDILNGGFCLNDFIDTAGGNSGTQITSTLVRAMALGEVGLRDLGRIVRKEMSTAPCGRCSDSTDLSHSAT